MIMSTDMYVYASNQLIQHLYISINQTVISIYLTGTGCKLKQLQCRGILLSAINTRKTVKSLGRV